MKTNTKIENKQPKQTNPIPNPNTNPTNQNKTN